MRPRFVRALCATVSCLAIAGCSITSSAPESPASGNAIQGVVKGGQQSIVGAHVYLFAAGASGYGGASTSLLTAGSGSDTIGEYVATDSLGNFSITGDYTCTAGAQVYLYSLGGNAGSGSNSAAGLLAALGQCPATGTFLATTPYVVINEVSTVAAAYATAGFATDATHISSSGTALATTGIANAFKNAANLASISTGLALDTTPAGNATVPQAEINTIANLLASCVNSAGPSSTACATLFADAKSSGTSGIAPTDTATAAINIAHNPAANVAALYGLSTGTPPFAPALTAKPSDFTLTLLINITANQLAVDASGNVWTCAENALGASVLYEYSSTGALLSPAGGYTGGGIGGSTHCNGPIAIDPAGNIWALAVDFNSNANPILVEFSSTGLPLSGSGYTGNGLSRSQFDTPSMAIDGSGNVWVANSSTLSEFTNLGAAALGSPFSGNGISKSHSAAIDNLGNVWVAGTVISKFTNAGAAATGSPFSGLSNSNSPIAIDGSSIALDNATHTGITFLNNAGGQISGSPFTGGGANHGAAGIAIDGLGHIWASTANGTAFGSPGALAELTSTGAALSPSTGFLPQGISGPIPIVVDGSGNVWTADYANGTIEDVFAITLGAATPVVTPLSVGVKNQALGTRP